MNKEKRTGRVQTVLGLIDADSLGLTSPHEHLLCEMSAYFIEPAEASERKLAHEPVSLHNLWWVRSHSISNLDNVKLNDEQLAIKEALLFKNAGGNTIVDLTPIGMNRDPLGLARISRATGLNVVMGSGYYIALAHPSKLTTMTENEIAEEIVKDIMVGVGNTGIRAGMIGEIGCSEPITDTERKVLRAAALAQQRTGAAINVHPSASGALALETIDILRDAGADLNHTIFSHVDLWNYDKDTCLKLADAGCYLEYDSLRTNAEIYPAFFLHPRLKETPSHLQVIDSVIDFISEGYLSQLLIAHDICYKHHLVSYGGAGYAHILRDILPVMRYKGITEEQINTLLIENPKRALQFAPIK